MFRRLERDSRKSTKNSVTPLRRGVSTANGCNKIKNRTHKIRRTQKYFRRFAHMFSHWKMHQNPLFSGDTFPCQWKDERKCEKLSVQWKHIRSYVRFFFQLSGLDKNSVQQYSDLYTMKHRRSTKTHDWNKSSTTGCKLLLLQEEQVRAGHLWDAPCFGHVSKIIGYFLDFFQKIKLFNSLKCCYTWSFSDSLVPQKKKTGKI